MKQAALIECSRRELAMSPESRRRRGAIVFLLVMAAVIGYQGVKLLAGGADREPRFPTGYESWHSWLGVLHLAGALVGAAGALVLIRSARRERFEPMPTIRDRALENRNAAQQLRS